MLFFHIVYTVSTLEQTEKALKINIQKYVRVMLRLDTPTKTLGDYPHFQKLGGVLF